MLVLIDVKEVLDYFVVKKPMRNQNWGRGEREKKIEHLQYNAIYHEGINT